MQAPIVVSAIALDHPPTSARSRGKVYVGVTHKTIHFTAHGPNSPGSRGQIHARGSAQEVHGMIRVKGNEGYRAARLADMPQPMIQAIVDHLRREDPTLSATYMLTNQGIEFAAPSGTGQPARQRPARRKRNTVAVWI